MITAKPLFVLTLFCHYVSGLEPSEPVGEPFMQNLLTEYEVLSEACDSLAQAELRMPEQAVGVLETKEADDMEGAPLQSSTYAQKRTKLVLSQRNLLD